ncbi:MAG: DUF5615 family PIN-like protein [Candidatus Eremiobacteraeota bacterium]|nr:DUF5615 family PIN-like protein [Candidatus Eremiobacteraeota bacterium]
MVPIARSGNLGAITGFVIVTKDEDFQRYSIRYGLPPRVIWSRLRNCSQQS